ncbi:3-methylcrotonyl-carboxylase, putative [Bodo saltans]|uniref:3-methylcrotonyl-carboxylase, putative n=1 Tax=Bodo saltans TaxID=75058 RepID=A0A0S4IX46_BODSA|nr:3-methylcrotonyl-carboxylase, putative [Bodo saltans]|eukprot:CUG06738.1 3-methylcrotonyl-carboxylase, putative [Bodo saltans]
MRPSRSLLEEVQRRTINKVLVANRGEIACRVFKTCKTLGIRTVAVYCDAESNGKHVQHADEAFRIGAPPAATSYLRGETIVQVAKDHGVDAIHPGYGFLSENAEFAKNVLEAGIEFIGPPSGAIISMGSKSESKIIMTDAGVPVVPGYHGEDQTEAHLTKEAARIGFPLLIKAVSGGGGKGMKIVRNIDEFSTLLQSAQREATNFFKDDRVLLERYIERPRHVEVQVFCDKHGNGVFFFERDCSVQRRYQKVLEEAPAPHFSAELRKSVGDVAVKAAKAVGYVGAGTVEFIFDTETNEFYFMEMNTRLQVEHPVTEEIILIKGRPLDLVRLQIETAEGKPFDFTQEDLAINGCCIEARVFAESPKNNFLPGSGNLTFVEEPAEGRFGDVKVRLDTGFRSGDDVLVHYDPMIAKLIVWGTDRPTALRGLRKALDDYHIVGISTNIEFLKKCCDNEAFAKGGVTTKFIEEHKETLLAEDKLPTNVTALAALNAVLSAPSNEFSFHVNGSSKANVPFRVHGAAESVSVQEVQRGSYVVSGPTFSHTIKPCAALKPGYSAAHIDGALRVEYKPIVLPHQVAILLPTGTYTLQREPLPEGFGDVKYQAGGASRVLSPMPGKVAKFLVANGATVVQGQNVLIVEAMKMEHLVKAPKDGVIVFSFKEGQMAGADQVLATIETSD